MKRFRGGLVFQPHRLLYHSTLGLRVNQKKKKVWCIRTHGGRVDEKGLSPFNKRFLAAEEATLKQKMRKGHPPRVIYHRAYFSVRR